LAGLDRPCQTSQIPATDVAGYYTDGVRGALNSDNFAVAQSHPDPDVDWGQFPEGGVASTSHDVIWDAPPPYRPTFAGVLYAFTPSSDGYLSVTAYPQLWWLYLYSYPVAAPWADVAIELGAYLEISQDRRDLTEGSGDLTVVNLHQFNHSESTVTPWRPYEFQRTVPVTPAGGPVIINLGIRVYTQGHWPGFAEAHIAFYNYSPIELELLRLRSLLTNRPRRSVCDCALHEILAAPAAVIGSVVRTPVRVPAASWRLCRNVGRANP
jgi:hypothetical protein